MNARPSRHPSAELLLDVARTARQSPRLSVIEFTGNVDADALVSNVSGMPHAFVIGCLFDRGVKAERAWRAPLELSARLGGFEFSHLARRTLGEFERAIAMPKSLHRFTGDMARVVFEAIKHIAGEYDGNASRIWSDQPSSAEVVMRFLAFHGAGPKIATMAANILARDFGIEMSDRASIDVSVDVHVERVFSRCGLVREGGEKIEFIYAARAIHPTYPGIMDFATWTIGRSFCHKARPNCGDCPLANACEYSVSNR